MKNQLPPLIQQYVQARDALIAQIAPMFHKMSEDRELCAALKEYRWKGITGSVSYALAHARVETVEFSVEKKAPSSRTVQVYAIVWSSAGRAKRRLFDIPLHALSSSEGYWRFRNKLLRTVHGKLLDDGRYMLQQMARYTASFAKLPRVVQDVARKSTGKG